MEFQNEDELQEFIADFFDARGDNVAREDPHPNAQKPNGYVIAGRKLDLVEKGQEWSKVKIADNHYSWIENKYINP